jgi:protoporphyrin/coproporphyrin ferrochelatase
MSVRGAMSPDAPRFDDAARKYDAVLVMSFGGPEGPADVMPFLERVTQGRNIPRERLLEVAHHYDQFGGVSPINAQNRALIRALEAELKTNGPDLPVYFGNRNSPPLIADTVREMRDAGVRRAVCFVTSGFSSYSGCRQYREDIIRALDAVPGAPEIDKIRVFFNHPGFIAPSVANLKAALEQVPAERRAAGRVAFTAHSIPLAMAKGSAYEAQLAEAARLVAEGASRKAWDVVYQSRSGAPHIPWLEPDVRDYLKAAAAAGATDIVLAPLGFISDHMEVLFDLDVEAKETAAELGLHLVRAATVGTAPAFVRMIRDLIVERMTDHPTRAALGTMGAWQDVCPVGCCLVRTGE